VIENDGKLVRFGSIASGGRYDGLVSRFKGAEIPAVGVSVGVSRLCAALDLLSRSAAAGQGPVVVLAFERERMADYQRMAAELRAAGLRAEVYLGGAGMKAQMRYADRRNSPVAVIEGPDERGRGEVVVKDLVLGAEIAAGIGSNAEWRETRAAQVAVPRAQLVEAVKRALKRA
jgi:histidyl-tRNA synthetase